MFCKFRWYVLIPNKAIQSQWGIGALSPTLRSNLGLQSNIENLERHILENRDPVLHSKTSGKSDRHPEDIGSLSQCSIKHMYSDLLVFDAVSFLRDP